MGFISKIIGNNIDKLRRVKNITLQNLSDDLGMSYQNLCKIINGNQFPKEETLETICTYFNISPSQLMTCDLIPIDLDNDINYKILFTTLKYMERKKLQSISKIINILIDELKK